MPVAEGKPKKRSLFGGLGRKAKAAKSKTSKSIPDMGTDTDAGMETYLAVTRDNRTGTRTRFDEEHDKEIRWRQFRPKKAVYGVAKVVGVGLVVLLYRDVSSLKQNQNTGTLELR